MSKIVLSRLREAQSKVDDESWYKKKREQFADEQFKAGFEACRIACLEIIAKRLMADGLAPHVIQNIHLFKDIRNLELINLPKGLIQ